MTPIFSHDIPILPKLGQSVPEHMGQIAWVWEARDQVKAAEAAGDDGVGVFWHLREQGGPEGPCVGPGHLPPVSGHLELSRYRRLSLPPEPVPADAVVEEAVEGDARRLGAQQRDLGVARALRFV